MKKFLPLIVGLVLLSCEKDGKKPVERNTVGEWKFVHAKFNPSDSFKKEDRTAEYRDHRIVLTDDAQVYYEVDERSETYSGWWEIEYVEEEEIDEGGDCYTTTVTYFRMHLVNDFTKTAKDISWSGFYASKKRMRGYQHHSDGVTYFVLMRDNQMVRKL